MCADFFDFVVDDVVDAALGFELRHSIVRRREVEPLRARLQVCLPEKVIKDVSKSAKNE